MILIDVQNKANMTTSENFIPHEVRMRKNPEYNHTICVRCDAFFWKRYDIDTSNGFTCHDCSSKSKTKFIYDPDIGWILSAYRFNCEQCDQDICHPGSFYPKFCRNCNPSDSHNKYVYNEYVRAYILEQCFILNDDSNSHRWTPVVRTDKYICSKCDGVDRWDREIKEYKKLDDIPVAISNRVNKGKVRIVLKPHLFRKPSKVIRDYTGINETVTDIILEYSGLDFPKSDLAGLDLSRAVYTCINLSGSNLAATNLSGANLSGANLSNCNLNGANLSSCNLNNANLTEAQLVHANLKRTNMKQTKLNKANLINTNMKMADLTEADLTGTNLHYTNLDNVKLDLTILVDQNLSTAILTKTSFIASNLTRVTINAQKLDKISFEGANLANCKLNGCSFVKANFSDTNLIKARITRCNFNHANFDSSNYLFSIMNAVDFTSANFTNIFIQFGSTRNCTFTGTIHERI